MKTQILTFQHSWFVPYGIKLSNAIKDIGHECSVIFHPQQIKAGDIMFILGYTQILPTKFLKLNRHNIVTHASDLPNGKGFQPVQWQVLNGNEHITITLFEAIESVDSGPFYLKRDVRLKGDELLDEIRTKLVTESMDMCLQYIRDFNNLTPKKQQGKESFYKQMKKENYQIDINKSIVEQFNVFRIADNNNYPVYFKHLGHKYALEIKKISNE